MRLKLQKLVKMYGDKTALDHFSYTFRTGIYGILGPNGAGKTTLMNLIIDNLKPDSGAISYNGEPISSYGSIYRKKIGYMPQQQKMYPRFSVLRFLYYMAALKGMDAETARERAETVLKQVNLYDVRYQKILTLSGGMRQRLLLAQSVLDDPEILLLDEPTAGLDPEERIRIRNLISALSTRKIVLYSTHVVSDIEIIADKVLFLNHGILCASGTVEEMNDSMRGHVFLMKIPAADLSKTEKRFLISEIKKSSSGILSVKVISSSKPEYPDCREAIPDLQDKYLELYKGSQDE